LESRSLGHIQLVTLLARFPGCLPEVLKEDLTRALQIRRVHFPRRLSEVQFLW